MLLTNGELKEQAVDYLNEKISGGASIADLGNEVAVLFKFINWLKSRGIEVTKYEG